jgi:hypothetical protein
MKNSTAHRVRIAAALTPVFVLATPALASAATDPGSAQQPGQYTSTQTSTDAQGTTRNTTMTYMGSDGPVYQRSSERVTPNGSSTHMVRSSNGRQETIDSRNDANGMTRTQTTNCISGDGQASYRRTVTHANPNGSGANTVTSGDANCAAIPAAPAADNGAKPATATQPTTDNLGSSQAPLVIVNPPAMPGK